MNELQRQQYLSAMGVDTYMPRWQLPFAPVSVVCEVAALVEEPEQKAAEKGNDHIQPVSSLIAPKDVAKSDPSIAVHANNVLADIFESKKVTPQKSQPISAASILAELDAKPVNIDAFSLSVWRPMNGMMVVDSRNSKLALPTELLLQNILQSFFPNQLVPTAEEILRWPMIENSFAKRTANDARVELQTWLSVQHEIRPIKHLWLMGANAATYFLPEKTSFISSNFQTTRLADSEIDALVLPSLNEILKNPALKQRIFTSLRHYHFSNS